MLFRIIIASLIIIDIILVAIIIHLSSLSILDKNIQQLSQFEIYIQLVTIIINIILICVFIMERNMRRKMGKTELLSFIDNNDNITIINSKIDEYINNYSIFEDKISLIYSFRNNLIINKRKELYLNLRTKLKSNNNYVTENIVKEEFALFKCDLDNYRIILNIKIDELIELHNIKIIIINM